MQTNKINPIKVVLEPGEADTGGLISDTVAEALRLIQESWRLDAPQDCSIYVMTSWWRFFFQSAPWGWRILLAITFPLWAFRARRTWPYSAGWTQRYGRRVAIGIKPPRLLESSDKSVDEYMFEAEPDTKTKVRHLLCHELTHACSADLKLPAWLNEGLAALTVDRYLQKRTIRKDTLELLRGFTLKQPPPTYRQLSRLSGKTLAYHAVRGYWLVRYLEDVRLGFLRGLFLAPSQEQNYDHAVAQALGLEVGSLWSRIDDLVVAHFEKKEAGSGEG